MSRARGFSLIEVLLATVLLAAGMALAFSTLSNATVATERAEALAQRNERLRAVQAFLRRQLENALPLPYEFIEGTGEATVFECEGDTLRLVAPMPGYLSRGGPYLQTFRLVRGADGLRLEFEHQLMTPDGPIDSEREPEILLEGIAEGEFQVRTLEDDGEPGEWRNRWDRPAQIPRLVQLQLRLRDERAHWPTLVAAPRLGLFPLPSAIPPNGGDLIPGEQP
ncbi:prepilin-type N-terminal cleavage/methylation domain-containing protein [Arenimonas sp. MALMAid1274]|uniref:prepilin-type N-terminal cleavage/methylation domain-containing protein n=1 Tax=Arenimonas sp. MALMAid1274 TaxID=3411630 RepID=UPI003BA0D3BC